MLSGPKKRPGTVPLLYWVAALTLGAFVLPGCVTKRRIYDDEGVLVDEQMIVKRPFSGSR